MREINNNPTIGICGFGTVGQAIAHGFGLTTDIKIYDIDPVISENTLQKVCDDSDFIFICLPTPVNAETGKSDYSTVEETIKKCREHVKNTHKILIIKSTLLPGTTSKLIEKYPDVRIIHNPEFLTARTNRLDFINAPMIVLGGELDNTRKVEELYRLRFASTPVFCTDPTTAEAVKCFINCFFATKISLCNEFYSICEALGIKYEEVINIMLRDGRIIANSHTDVPGYDGKFGFGGRCFPKDICATIECAKDIGVDPIMLKAAWKKNLKVRKFKD